VAHPEQGIRLEIRYRHKDGSWRYLEAGGQNRLADPEINAGRHQFARRERPLARRGTTCATAKNNTACCFTAIPTRCGFSTWRRSRFWKFNEAAIQHYGYSREEFWR